MRFIVPFRMFFNVLHLSREPVTNLSSPVFNMNQLNIFRQVLYLVSRQYQDAQKD